jgi:hypothetical protein
MTQLRTAKPRGPVALRPASLLGVVLALLGAGRAHAAPFPPPFSTLPVLESPGLHPVLQLQHTCSGNLFGLSSGAAAQAAFGDDQLADCWTTAQAGLRYDDGGAVGRLHGHALLDRTVYQHYRALDDTGHDVSLGYDLNHAPQWNLYLGASDTSAQQDLTMLQAPLRDRVHQQVLSAGGAHALAGRVDATADAAWIRIRNDAPSQRPYDMNIAQLRAGPRYTSAAGNTLAFSLGAQQGSYPNASQQVGGTPPVGYRQIDGAARFAWTDDAFWKLGGSFGYLGYRAEGAGVGNFSGLVADLGARRSLTAATALQAALYRKLVPYNTLTTRYQVLTGGQIGLSWQLSAAVDLRADYSLGHADYPGTSRRDRIQRAEFVATYQPRPGMQFALRFAHSERSSNALNSSYAHHDVGLLLRQAF